MSSIKIEELKKLPYLDASALDGRLVNMMPYWDGSQWHMWLETDVGLIEGKIADTIESDYLAKEAAKPTDLYIPFLHFMWQHASWKEICPLIIAISEDFHKMGTSVAKLRLFHGSRKQIGDRGTHKFALTELEYLVSLCRSVFDLLQEIITWIWKNTVRLKDEKAEAFRRKTSLPSTFSKVVLHEKERLRTKEEIVVKFGVPLVLAEAYTNVGPFFADLRALRDKIIHGGRSFDMVFDTEKGFCVSPTGHPFDKFQGWKSEHYYNKNLVSVLPWLADLILKTIDACTSLTQAFCSVVQFPKALAPDHFVFVRGYHSAAFVDLLGVRDGGSVWWGDQGKDEAAGS